MKNQGTEIKISVVDKFNEHLSAFGRAYRNWYSAADYPSVEKARERVLEQFRRLLDENECLKDEVEGLRRNMTNLE